MIRFFLGLTILLLSGCGVHDIFYPAPTPPKEILFTTDWGLTHSTPIKYDHDPNVIWADSTHPHIIPKKGAWLSTPRRFRLVTQWREDERV